MKNVFFTRVLSVVLILGLMSAYITPSNVNAATISPQPAIETPPPVIQSISGSQITLDTTAGHPGGYVPGVSTTIYFRSDVKTDDYEWLENTWLRFPTDWTITDVTVVGIPTCTSGTGAWGNFALSYENSPYEIQIQHSAIMATADQCTAVYAIQLTPGASPVGPALVSWYYAGDTGPVGAKKPHYVCSEDKYTPPSMAEFKCEEWDKPLVSIPVAVPPVADTQTVTTNEDTAKAITLSATDPNSLPLTYTVTKPTHGTVVLLGNVATYTPYANYNGGDSFTFKANNGLVDSNIATVTITVSPVPDAPIAQNLAVFTVEDTARVIGLLATDADGDTLTYSIMAQPTHGTVVLVGNVATYTPASNYTGPDSFTFKANDGGLDSNIATISITVNPVNDPPVAQSQSVTTAEDTAKPITLVATDVDNNPLTYSIVGLPLHGTLSGTAPNLTYTPVANYNGPDSFTFRANDGTANSDNALVSITVTPVNDPPVAQGQTVTTAEDTAVGITLAATDVEEDTLSYLVLTGPAHGLLTGTAPNLTYTPSANYFGPDGFTFIANDGTANSSNSGTVNITVTAVNDAPIAQDQNLSVLMDTPTAITLVATDADGDPLNYSVLSGPASGVLTGTAPNLIYTRNSAFLGTDSFTFKANDGTTDSLIATVSIIVKTNNNPPVATGQSVDTPEETAKDITLVATDADILDSLIFSVVQPAHGIVVLSGNVATYTPSLNYNGPDSFTFTATDGIAISNVATVSITVNPVNDAPTSLALSKSTLDENVPIGTVVGMLTTNDVDSTVFTYTFVDGGADNGAFTISGDQLLTNALLDFETKNTYSIYIRTTDQGPMSFVQNFVINVNDLNEAPTNLSLSYSSVEENMAVNTVVGTLSSTDQDTGNTFIYTLVTGGVDNASFNISGDQLRTSAMFDFEAKASYSIRIRTTDQGGLFFEKEFTVTVIDVNEPPVVSDIPNQTILEGLTFATINLDGYVSDQDNTDAEMTWSFTSNTDLSISIVNQVATITIPNLDWNGSEAITFRATDPGSLWDEDAVTLTVTPVNDAPVAQEGFVATNKDVPVAITLVATDVDGDALTYTVVVQPRFGTLSGVAPDLTYTPDAGFVGADNLSFMVNDAGLLSNPAMVTINVNQTTSFIFLPMILH